MRKSAEDAISQVLEGLRDVEAPIGMERRILDAVLDRASVRSVRMPLWAWSAALACAMVACIAVAAVYRTARVPVPSMHSVLVDRTPKADLETPVRSVPTVLAAQSVRSKTNENGKRAKVARDNDAAALREMHAASFPAPPMPLTEQEKLLLRIAHRRDPEQLAMLNQELRDKREADSNAEFQKFFEPTITGDSE
ncbi:hypothetical protein EDE15_3205 [Edaphobacter aggregans]|uniref:Uncharacterized protein n=1 Tax=Edaphobacter aggregans TaxID=570835 RepID=A0A3R9WI04_9BACT|nr:hypothetical protein [Edaphobacter aggregans]RSL17669.1 hypothetical protein EDE15_3205 [Edaphobacter aggregans]